MRQQRITKKISYSAPAKVILSGEHAVVYGKPALVSALDIRLKFTIFPSSSSRTSFGISKKMPKQIQPDNNTDKIILMISDQVKDYLKKNKLDFKDKKFNYKVDSNIPVKQRLGSSAAFCVAATASFLEFYTGRTFNKETINNIAYQCEKFFHTNASGVDVSVSTFGGLIFYRKEFEFLKNISSLNFKITRSIEKGLYLIDSGNPAETTGEMVESVGRTYNKKPDFTVEVLNNIEKTTKRLVISIVKEDVDFFVKCLVDNQVLLDMLGVVSNRAKNLLKKLESYGYGKVTGGGGKKAGSGFMLFYADKIHQFEKYCKDQKIPYFKFRQSYEGVKKE